MSGGGFSHSPNGVSSSGVARDMEGSPLLRIAFVNGSTTLQQQPITRNGHTRVCFRVHYRILRLVKHRTPVTRTLITTILLTQKLHIHVRRVSTTSCP